MQGLGRSWLWSVTEAASQVPGACARLRSSSSGRHTRDDDGCDHRRQLTRQRQPQDAPHRARQPQLGEFSHKLRGACPAVNSLACRCKRVRAHTAHTWMVNTMPTKAAVRRETPRDLGPTSLSWSIALR